MDTAGIIKVLDSIEDHYATKSRESWALVRAMDRLNRLNKLESLLEKSLPEQDPCEEVAWGQANAFALVLNYLRTGQEW